VRVLLLSPNTERINMPVLPIGLHLVEAATRAAGHETRILDLLGEPDAGDAIRRAVSGFAPDVVGVSIRNIDDQEMENTTFLLERVRPVLAALRAATRAPIVLGGAGYSIFPDAALAFLGADAGVAGEGEFAFPELLGRLARREDPAGLPGVHLPGRGGGGRTFARDLDRAPLPADYPASNVRPDDPDLYVPIQSRRGCPLGCSYCSTASIEGRSIRARSPALVADEFARIADRGFPRLHFVDNTFNHPPSYARELCREIRNRGRRAAWRAIVYPLRVDAALVADMAAAGCVEVSLGFESGAPAVLAEMRKRFAPADVRAACGLFRDHGIRRMGFLLLGGPGETVSTARESLDFADSLDLSVLKTTVGIRIYPGTPLHRKALDDGVVTSDDDLLHPRFYVVPGLLDRLRAEVAARASSRPGA
jgi:radical SAM superfamily enzyme YgiQ (UPF0313 family)